MIELDRHKENKNKINQQIIHTDGYKIQLYHLNKIIII